MIYNQLSTFREGWGGCNTQLCWLGPQLRQKENLKREGSNEVLFRRLWQIPQSSAYGWTVCSIRVRSTTLHRQFNVYAFNSPLPKHLNRTHWKLVSFILFRELTTQELHGGATNLHISRAYPWSYYILKGSTLRRQQNHSTMLLGWRNASDSDGQER